MDGTTLRRILTSVFILALISATVTSATFATFSEGDQIVNADIFDTGTISLTLTETAAFTTALTHTNMAPGDQTTATLLIVNDGTIYDGDSDGHHVDIDITVSGDVNAFTQRLKIIEMTYGGTSLATGVADANENGYTDLADMITANAFNDLDGPSNVGKSLVVTLELDHLTTQGDLSGVTGAADLQFDFDLRNVPLNTS